MMILKNNYYMICSLSFLPMMLSLNMMNLFMMLMLLLLNCKKFIYMFSFFSFLLNFIMWFSLMNSEYNLWGMENLNLENSMKLFFFFFIISELMIFISLFWTFFSYYMVLDLDLGKFFPPYLFKNFDWNLIPLINTFILVLSSVTITSSHFFFFKNNINMMYKLLMITIFLGLTFSMFQMIEYKNSFYGINDSVFGSLFFILTGLHGLHVLIGTIILIFSFVKSFMFNSINSKSETFEMGSWYWHFVDLIWLIVFYSLYYII